jgi:hypothetical protein
MDSSSSNSCSISVMAASSLFNIGVTTGNLNIIMDGSTVTKDEK